MNDHYLIDSSEINEAFFDTGTTFSYFPSRLWDSIMFHFDLFCE